jgi:predicted permease
VPSASAFAEASAAPIGNPQSSIDNLPMLSDLRLALRRLVHAPGFTAVVLLTLALGIGTTTAVFSIVNGVLLRPLDHPEPEQLVDVRVACSAFPQYPIMPLNARFYVEWKACPAFSHFAMVDRFPGEITLTGAGEPERLRSLRVSANLFDTLGVAATLGRTFQTGDDASADTRVAVISDGLWRRRFSADPAILGRSLTLDQEPFIVVGVLPAGFRLPVSSVTGIGRSAAATTELFLPKFLSEKERNNIIGQFNYDGVGRLAPGITVAEAEAQMNVIAARLSQLAGGEVQVGSSATPMQEAVVGHARRGLLVLLGAITTVLLIACLNLAVLALVRAERGGHDAAVRAALGASQGRLLRAALLESVLLAIAGGALGILVARGTLSVLLFFAPANLPRLDEVGLDGTVLGFAVLLTSATALLFGLLPAWRTARSDPGDALRGSGRTTTGGRADTRLRHGLVAAEVGLGAMLLVTAALLLGSFVRVLQTDPGFAAPTVLTADIAIPMAKYSQREQRTAFHARLLERIRSVPGVEAAAISTALPMQGQVWIDSLWTKDNPVPQAERLNCNVRFVSADYFAALGIPLRAGRSFEEADGDRPVAVISEKVAAHLWPGQNPLGRRMVHHGREDVEVVGIVGDLRANADTAAVPVVYRPYSVWPPARVQLIARANGSPRALAGSLRAALREVDSDVPVPAFRTMNDLRDASVAERRFQVLLASSFGVAALLLSGLGIYGVISYAVARRTKEIGIRAAFGAQTSDLRALVLRQGLTPVAIGLAVGLACALGLGRVLGAMLYETRSDDPLVYAGVAAVLIVVAVAACWMPARRATRVDPMEALRTD